MLGYTLNTGVMQDHTLCTTINYYYYMHYYMLKA